jgi:glyoxylase-like metal-dependent hydrolase (beta-lactamase superfamily II)
MRVRAVVGIYESNTFVVEYDGVVIVVDAGAEVREVLKVLNGRKPNAILLTHEHFDHVFHIADYCEAFDCQVFCHKATRTEIETKDFLKALAKRRGTEECLFQTPASFEKFADVSDEKSFVVGGLEIKPYFCPGHSEGSVVYLARGELFTGDVLFADCIGRTDLMESGNELMQETLKKLQDVKFEMAYHGHYESSNYTEQQKNILNFIDN